MICCEQTASTSVINVLWSLMEASVEELKLLQTAILLITTNSVVQHDALAKVGSLNRFWSSYQYNLKCKIV